MKGNASTRPTIPFIPHHISAEVSVALFVVGGIFYLAGMAPHGLGEPANPLVTPPHIKPEWYFLWAFQLLRMLPKLLGILLPGAIFGLLFLVPWLERREERHPARRPLAVGMMTGSFLLLVILTVMGLN